MSIMANFEETVDPCNPLWASRILQIRSSSVQNLYCLLLVGIFIFAFRWFFVENIQFKWEGTVGMVGKGM